MKDKDRIGKWIDTMLDEVSKLSDNKGMKILHECGIECSNSSELLQGAQKIRKEYGLEKDTDKLFNAFKNQYYKSGNLTKEGNQITLIFDACTCPLVKEGVSNSYLCNCTAGYSKNIFETLFGQKVEVELKKTILRGDKICRQKINIIE